MHVANQPAEIHVAHDVFDAGEGRRHAVGIDCGIRFVEHHKKDACDQLDRQNNDGQRTEEIPEVEVLRCVVFG